jgi:hypothetical protein
MSISDGLLKFYYENRGSVNINAIKASHQFIFDDLVVKKNLVYVGGVTLEYKKDCWHWSVTFDRTGQLVDMRSSKI